MIKQSKEHKFQPKTERIKDIRKRHRNRWLLVAVDSMDRRTNHPQTGHVIASSPTREDIYRRSIAYKGKKPAMFIYSGKPRKDVAYIFFNHASNSA